MIVLIFRKSKYLSLSQDFTVDNYAKQSRGPTRDQTGGYEGCKMDYESVVKPVTDRILTTLVSVDPIYDMIYSVLFNKTSNFCESLTVQDCLSKPTICVICNYLQANPELPPLPPIYSKLTDWARQSEYYYLPEASRITKYIATSQ